MPLNLLMRDQVGHYKESMNNSWDNQSKHTNVTRELEVFIFIRRRKVIRVWFDLERDQLLGAFRNILTREWVVVTEFSRYHQTTWRSSQWKRLGRQSAENILWIHTAWCLCQKPLCSSWPWCKWSYLHQIFAQVSLLWLLYLHFLFIVLGESKNKTCDSGM